MEKKPFNRNASALAQHAKLISSFPMLAAFTVACGSVQAIYKLILNAVAKSVLQELIFLPVGTWRPPFLCSVSKHEFV